MPFRFLTGAVRALLVFVVLSSACENADSIAGPASIEEDIPLGASSQSLAENRLVQVDVVDSLAVNGVPVGSQRIPVQQIDKFLVGACYWELAELFGRRSAPFPSFDAAAAKPSDAQIWLDTFALNSECNVESTNPALNVAPPLPPLTDGTAKAYKGWAVPWLWGCMGDLALAIAENPSGSSIVPHPSAGYTIVPGPSKDALMRIPAPSASDRASWYLLAADHHQIAVTQAASLFDRTTADGTTCPQLTWNDEFDTDNGETSTVGLTIATVASHGLQRMLEAGEKAQQYIVAAAESHMAGAASINDAVKKVWRAPLDSRLEGASAYLGIAPNMFDGRGYKQLFRMSNGEQTIVTTAPGLAPTGFVGAVALDGFVPQTTSDGATVPLITWRYANNVYQTIATNGVSETAPPAGATLVRREGYLFPTSSAGRKGLTVKRGTVVRSGVSVNIFFTALTGDEIPVRYTTDITSTGFVVTKPAAGDYPVYVSTEVSAEDRRAEDLIRTYFLNAQGTGSALATDLLAALNRRYAVGTTTAPLGTSPGNLLKSLFDTNDAGAAEKILASAGSRIFAKAQLLGKPIIAIPGTSAPTMYTVPALNQPVPAEPAFLFAVSAGSSPSGSYSDSAPYAKRGIAHTVDYLRRAVDFRASQTDPTLVLPAPVMKLLGAANGYANAFADPDFAVTVSCLDATTPDGCLLRIAHGPNPPADTLATQTRFDAWAGVAGLECALRGSIGEVPCAPGQYQLAETAFAKVAPAAGEPYGASTLRVVTTGLGGQHIFLTRKGTDGRNSAIFGFYPFPQKANGMYPLMGDGVREVVNTLLAPDPDDPEAGATTCAGIPRNAKVLLEDELIAVNLDDRYDQSFRYYLDEARKAAEQADLLGKEIVVQGLAMDTRAETAIEQLEDLCGGSINLAPLEEKACTTHKCDLVAYLKDPTVIVSSDLQTQLEGARQCLGIGGSNEPIWVAVGDQPLCAWRYAPGKVLDAKSRPCGVCPSGAKCPKECPLQPERAANNSLACVIPEADALPFVIPDTLGVSVTRTDFYAEPEEDERLKWLIARYLSERSRDIPAGLGIKDPKGSLATTQWEQWVTDHRLSPIAQQLGYFQDFDATLPLVTKGGDVWLDLEQLFQVWDFAAAAGYDPYLGRNENRDGAMPWPCGAVDVSVAKVCDQLTIKPYEVGWPLICGRMCGVYEGGRVDVERTNAVRADLAQRTTQAIIALKQLTGESFENVVRVSHGVTVLAQDLLQQPPQWRDVWYTTKEGPPPESQIANMTSGAAQASWVKAFLFGDFEYAGTMDGAPYYYGSPPAETNSHQGRCLSWGDGLRCDYLGTPETFPAPPGVWEGKLCVHKQSISDTNVGAENQTDTQTTFEDEGCGQVRELLEGGLTEVRYNRSITTEIKVSKWCVPLLKRTKIDRLVHDSIEHDDLDDRFTVCFGREADAKAWADEVNAGALDALAVGDQPLCGVGGVLEANPSTSARLCGAVGTLDPLGITNTIAGWLKSSSTSVRAKKPEPVDDKPISSNKEGKGVVSSEVFLDALQLAHLVAIEDQGTCDTLWGAAPEITSVADFNDVRKRMECSADRVELQLSRMALGGIPRDLVEALRDASKASVDLAGRGEYGQTLLKLVTAAQNFGRQRDVVVQAMRNLALEFDMGEAKLKSADLNIEITDIDAYINALEQGIQARELDSIKTQSEINRLRLRQSVQSLAHQAAMSIQAALPSFSCGIGEAGCSMSFSPGAMNQSILQTVHSGVMIDIESSVAELQGDLTVDATLNAVDRTAILRQVAEKIAASKELNELEKEMILIDLQQGVLEKADLINEAASGLNETYGNVLVLVAELEQIRAKSRRAAAKALLLENDDMGKQYNVNITMRATMNTLKVRYERARDAAIRASFLARRAIEQKLGVDLSSLTSDVGWVQAPSAWADTVCTMSGINYAEIRNNQSTNNDAGKSLSGSVVVDANGRHYADAFVGEYVSKLEQFVEAYRAQYPFQDADDTMVVSLRDELLDIKKACDVVGHNALFQSVGMVGEAWSPDCTGGACLAATPLSSGPFACASTAAALGAGNEGTPCDSIGASSSVELTYAGASSAATNAVWTPPTVSAYEVAALDGIETWIRPEECTSTGCPSVVSNGRAVSVPSGSTMPTVTRAANGTSWFSFTGASRLDLAPAVPAPVVTATLTFSAVVMPGSRPSLFRQDVTRTDGKVDRYEITMRQNVLRFTEIRDVLGATPVTRTTPTSYIGGTNPMVVSVRLSNAAAELWLDGQLYAGRNNTFLATPVVPFALGGKLGERDSPTSDGGGQFGEVMLFSRALSPIELSLVHRYLAARYAVTIKTDAPLAIPGVVSWLTPLYCAEGDIMTCEDFGNPNNVVTNNGGLKRWMYFNNNAMFTGNSTSQYLNVNQTDRRDARAVTIVAVVAPTFWSVGDAVAANTAGDWTIKTNSVSVAQFATLPLTKPVTKARDERGILTFRSGAAKQEFMIDGAVHASRPIAVGQEPTFSLFPYDFGKQPSSSIQRADLLMFDRALSDRELAAVHSYLAQRYAITLRSTDTGSETRPRYVQPVNVSEGAHWLSWYEESTCATKPLILASAEHESGTREALEGVGCMDATTPMTPSSGRPARWLRAGWSRRFAPMNVVGSERLLVGFSLAAPAPTTLPPNPNDYATGFEAAANTYWANVPKARIAAPQLERIQDDVSSGPRQFFPTDDDLSWPLGECPDDSGDGFRNSELWTRECEYYCPFGTGENCADFADLTTLPKRCYRQITFTISQEDIEAGRLIPQGGFALGNFNYRHNTFAVNVVGTGVKDCSKSAQPGPCYANNFLQFTVHHDGPYRVRNYDGDTYYAPLNPGRVQQAKSLTAERYLTNPMSSADRSLLSDYWRDEFRGRPLDGNYTLRLYEPDGLQWGSLEDVQIVFNYRYWTRSK